MGENSRQYRANVLGGQFGVSSTGRAYFKDNSNTIVLEGDATCWDDWSVPLTPAQITPSISKPDYDYTNLGLLFPQGSSEYVVGIAQMQHRKLLNSGIHFHVHHIQASTAQDEWKLSYRWYNNNSASSTFTIITSTESVYDLTTGILQITRFPEISPPSSENVSSNFEYFVWKSTDGYSGDTLAKYIDFHYQIDQFGSDDEYHK